MLNKFYIAGDWWESIAIAEQWYDDEIHGPEVGSGSQDL